MMTRSFTLGAGATLTAKVNYGIEAGYDYANVIISTNGGTTWQTLPTNLSNSTVEANGIAYGLRRLGRPDGRSLGIHRQRPAGVPLHE